MRQVASGRSLTAYCNSLATLSVSTVPSCKLRTKETKEIVWESYQGSLLAELQVSMCWSSFQQRLEQSDASHQKAMTYLNHWAKRRTKNPILFILLWSYFTQHYLFPCTVYKAQGAKYALQIRVLIIAIKTKHLKMEQKFSISSECWVLLNLHWSGTAKYLYMTFCLPESKSGQQHSNMVPYKLPAAMGSSRSHKLDESKVKCF